MLKLYGFPSYAGLRSPSPWVMKGDLALRYLELDYSLVQPEMIRFYRDVPSKRVPNLLIGDESFVESERILKVLEKYATPRTFPHPDDEDQASGIAFVRLVEDHLFYIIGKSKHLDSTNTPIMWAEMFPSRWLPISYLGNMYGQRKAAQRIASTSIGGLTDTEVREEAIKDIQTLVTQLSRTNFIAANSLTIYDFTVAAHIASILFWKIDNWLAPLFREHQVCYDYLARVAGAVGGFDYEVPRS